MSGGRIFLVGREPGELVPMTETSYTTEDVLQDLLMRYPDLLAGEQIDPDSPRRWLLVARELGVPGEEGGSSAWSLDHLFLDQDGVPTFVECKRASDTRSRREVIAQMLDYAANGTAYWPIDRIRQAAAETAQAAGTTIDDRVRELLAEDDSDVDAFWATVERNLRAGRVRLLFVADRTHRELRRLVEFLNEKMSDVEVLAIEVKQYLGTSYQVVVPRVIGLTEAVRSSKTSSPAQKVTRDIVMAKSLPAATRLFAFVLGEAHSRSHAVSWGTSGFSVGALSGSTGRRIAYCFCYPPDLLQLSLEFPVKSGLVTETAAKEWREELRGQGGLSGAGKYTLSANVTAENEAALRQSHTEFVERIEQLAREA